MVMVAENQPKISCCSVQLPYMAAECKVPVKEFKITTKQVWDASKDNSCEKTVKDIVDDGHRNRIIGGGNKRLGVNILAKGSMAANSGKRKPEMSVDGQRWKKQKQKIDPNLKIQLSKLLKELINHPVGWIFREPVDPVKLQIPDYFSIITKPMDLGTILHKLEENIYCGADEFAADVRLTFANAMSYNPPGNDVHQFAKTLDAAFSRKWRLLEAKLKHEVTDEEVRCIDRTGSYGCKTKKIGDNNHQNMKPIGLKRAPLPVKHGTSRLMSLDEKQKFRLELVQLISRKMIGKLQTVFQKFGLAGLDKERLDSYIDSTDDETLWKLRREVKVLLGANDGKVKAAKINGCSSLSRAVGKVGAEHCSQSALAYAVSTNQRQSVDSACLRNGAAQGCGSDISSDRSTEHNHCDDSKLEHEFRYPLQSTTSSSSLDSDGPGVVVNEATSSHLSTPACIEGWTFDVSMSPKKALRAAMLKKRFADMIFKATHQELLDHSDKPDPLRMQQARERLEKEQQEEKAKLEAQIKAAEAASQRREQNLKMRYERERKAARMAMEKMKRSVEINDNVGICKGLEILNCGYLYYPIDGNGMGSDGIHRGNPLEQLSLYLKDDFSEEDEDAFSLDREEGEILL